VPLAQAYHWSSGEDEFANLVLFTVETDEGLSGHGESICDEPTATAAYGRMIAEAFLGRSPGDIEAILAHLWTHGRWRVIRRVTNQVLSGIEAACWDVHGKALGGPASTFFGGRVRDEVDFFGFIQGDAPAEVADHALALRDDGFDVLYLKAGLGRVKDIERVAAVREAVGDGPALRVDPNEAWDVATAIDQIRKLEAFDIDWVEQPIPGDNVRGLAQVRARVAAKIAADNAVYSAGELREVLQQEAADAVVLAGHESGGLWRFRKMAYLAEVFGIPINRKGYLESSISTFASLQVLATVPNLTAGNQLTHQLLAESLTSTPLPIQAGKAHVPDLPGLGFELDADAVSRASARYQAAVG
jgi:L-alanine-DL-glutamate epimerase-like enolase superfamily enzyme